MNKLSPNIKEKTKSATGGVVINDKDFENFYLPLVERYINDKKSKRIKTYIIGIHGWQGSGKTVLATLIKEYLNSKGYRAEAASIDDFYKSARERIKIFNASRKNPFYKTRGLPGTHKTIVLRRALAAAKNGNAFLVPRFDKSLCGGKGDVAGRDIVRGRLDFFVLEGWCVNMPCADPRDFLEILSKNRYAKKILREIDPEQKFYQAVLFQLKKYQKIWNLLDNKTALFGQDIKWIYDWRAEQEKRMKKAGKNGMAEKETRDFVKPYIPFSYFAYDLALKNERLFDCLLTIKKNHSPEKIIFRDA